MSEEMSSGSLPGDKYLVAYTNWASGGWGGLITGNYDCELLRLIKRLTALQGTLMYPPNIEPGQRQSLCSLNILKRNEMLGNCGLKHVRRMTRQLLFNWCILVDKVPQQLETEASLSPT
jgi:hypothetical protein